MPVSSEYVVHLNLRGDKDVIRKLRSLPSKIRKTTITRSARESLKPMLASARRNAPKRTGALRKAMKLRVIPRNRRGTYGCYISLGEKWYVGHQFYGAFQEFGYRLGTRPTSGNRDADNRPEVPGKHFIENAYREHGLRAMYTFMDRVRERVFRGIQ